MYRVILIAVVLMNFLTSCSRKPLAFSKNSQLYKSENLKIIQIAANSFVHVSYLKTNDFGKVACNGLIVIDESEALVFDTPTNDAASEELIDWVANARKAKIKAIIPTHFHFDCLGGLAAFHKAGIGSIAHEKTIELAQKNEYPLPQNGFTGETFVKIGSEKIELRFWGEGHTRDNIVGFFGKDKVLFGGCLVKELEASKGFLGDANLDKWSETVARVKAAYPNAKKVVPGHGKVGGTALLDYTIDMFKKP